MKKFINLTGKANIAAGIFLLAFWYLYALLLPYNQLNTTLSILVLDQQWIFVNSLGVIGSLLGLFGLMGVYIYAADRTGALGMLGFILAFLGSVLFTSSLLWDTQLWPILANYDPSLLDFSGPVYSSRSYIPFFILSGLIYSLGYVIFGIGMVKSAAYPYWGSIAMMLGAPLFGLGAAFGVYQVVPRSVGITLFCIGLMWVGRSIQFDRLGKLRKQLND